MDNTNAKIFIGDFVTLIDILFITHPPYPISLYFPSSITTFRIPYFHNCFKFHTNASTTQAAFSLFCTTKFTCKISLKKMHKKNFIFFIYFPYFVLSAQKSFFSPNYSLWFLPFPFYSIPHILIFSFSYIHIHEM